MKNKIKIPSPGQIVLWAGKQWGVKSCNLGGKVKLVRPGILMEVDISELSIIEPE